MAAEDDLPTLDAQVASGQISIDDYLRRRAAIAGGPAHPGSGPAAASESAGPQPGPAERPAGQTAAQAAAPPEWNAAAPLNAGGAGPTPDVGEPGRPGPTTPPGSAVPPSWRPDPVAPVWTTTAGGGGGDQPPGRPAWGGRPEPAPGSTPPKKRKTGPLIAILALVAALVVAGGVWFALRGDDNDNPDGPPPLSGSSSTSSSATPTESPDEGDGVRIGPLAGVTTQGDVSGTRTLAAAVDSGQMLPEERAALAACGATSGVVEAFLVNGKWSSRSWNFECSSVDGAKKALATMDKFFRDLSFAPVDVGSNVNGYLRSEPGDYRLHAQYVSDRTVVISEVSSAEAAISTDATKQFVTAASKKLPPTYHVTN